MEEIERKWGKQRKSGKTPTQHCLYSSRKKMRILCTRFDLSLYSSQISKNTKIPIIREGQNWKNHKKEVKRVNRVQNLEAAGCEFLNLRKFCRLRNFSTCEIANFRNPAHFCNVQIVILINFSNFILLRIIISTLSLCFVILYLFPVTHFIEILISFHSFNKKLLNIVISDPVSINPHVHNLVYGIFTNINTIVENVISFMFVFLRKYMSSLYIYIPSFVILYLSNLFRKLFPKRIVTPLSQRSR